MAKEAAEASNRKKSKDKPGASKISYLPDIHRTLPQSVDAERGVLSSILLDSRAVCGLAVEKGITEDYFHTPANGIIYKTLIELWNAAKPIDLILLTQLLSNRGLLDQVGGPAYVTELLSFVPTAANAEFYIDIVIEKFTLRQIIGTCTEFAARSYDEQDDVPRLLDEVEASVFAIANERYKGKLPSLKDHVFEAIESIEKLYERRGSITGIATGFTNIDRMTDGLHGSEMFVIAARPSMGKTALAMNIAEYVCVDLNKAVAVFSLEMSAAQLVQRLLCSRARVNLKKIKDGFLTDRDFPAITTAGSQLSSSQMFIDDTAGLSILELRAKARRLKTQHDIQLIVIDYLQLLRSPSRRAQDNRQLEIAEISSGVKALAKELNIPIIVLAQLNRNPESRSGGAGGAQKGRPRLSDLRESGSIEQDADVVSLLVREEYYADGDEEVKAALCGKATLIIAKQRNGPVGDVPLAFHKEFTRFEDATWEAGEGGGE
jgi:replicative DNA helicase